MFLMAIITFFAGQLVWRDRDERMDEIRDSLPMRDWLFYSSKLLTLLIAIFAIMLVAILAGVIVQAFRGYTRFHSTSTRSRSCCGTSRRWRAIASQRFSSMW
jgi:ABC-2 type transport system permease protein